MADPTKYTPAYDFSAWQSSNPTKPLPGNQVDNELANVALSVDEAIDAIKDIRRSDGALNNQIVTPDSLSSATRSLISDLGTLRGEWATATVYAVKDVVSFEGATYFATVAHTSGGSFATDQAAGKWLLLASPYSISGAVFSQVFSGDGSEDTFTLSQEFNDISELQVYVRDDGANSGYELYRGVGASPQITLVDGNKIVFASGLEPPNGTSNVLVLAVNQTAASSAAVAVQAADDAETAQAAAEAAQTAAETAKTEAETARDEAQAILDDVEAAVIVPGDNTVSAAKIVTSDSGRWGITQILRFLQAGTSAAYRWVSDKLRERVSPEDFGAVGNGSTDDYAALLAACTYANSVNGVVELTAGKAYAIGTPLVIPSGWSLGIRGHGNQSRIIPQFDDATVLSIGDYVYTGSNDYVNGDQINKCFLENVCVDANDAGKDNLVGVDLRGANKGRFKVQTYGCRVGLRVNAISNYNEIDVFADGPNCDYAIEVDGAGFNSSYNSTENKYRLTAPFVDIAGFYAHGEAVGDIVIEHANVYGNSATAGILLDGTGSSYANNIKIGPVHIDGSATYGLRAVDIGGLSIASLVGGGAIGTAVSLSGCTGQAIWDYTNGALLGNATGGLKGAGTLNVVTGIYVNGAAVPVIAESGNDRTLGVSSTSGNSKVEIVAQGAVQADFTTDRATGAAQLRNRSAGPVELFANDTKYFSISSSGVITLTNGAVLSSPTLSGTVTGPHTGDRWTSTGLGLGISPLTVLDVKTGTDQTLRARGPVTLGSGVSWNAENDAGSANVNLEIRAGTTMLLSATTVQLNGAVRFGTFTSNADAAVNGYITITDAGGTTRKLATIA